VVGATVAGEAVVTDGVGADLILGAGGAVTVITGSCWGWPSALPETALTNNAVAEAIRQTTKKSHLSKVPRAALFHCRSATRGLPTKWNRHREETRVAFEPVLSIKLM